MAEIKGMLSGRLSFLKSTILNVLSQVHSRRLKITIVLTIALTFKVRLTSAPGYLSRHNDGTPDMDVGWVHPWVRLGWVGLGRVRSNMILCQRALHWWIL